MTTIDSHADSQATLRRADHNREHPYAQISRALIRDQSLSPAARWLLIYLLSMSDNWAVKMAQIISHVKGYMGRDQVYKVVRECMDAGYIYRREYLSHGRKQYDYLVSETREFQKKIQFPESQYTADQDTKEITSDPTDHKEITTTPPKPPSSMGDPPDPTSTEPSSSDLSSTSPVGSPKLRPQDPAPESKPERRRSLPPRPPLEYSVRAPRPQAVVKPPLVRSSPPATKPSPKLDYVEALDISPEDRDRVYDAIRREQLTPQQVVDILRAHRAYIERVGAPNSLIATILTAIRDKWLYTPLQADLEQSKLQREDEIHDLMADNRWWLQGVVRSIGKWRKRWQWITSYHHHADIVCGEMGPTLKVEYTNPDFKKIILDTLGSWGYRIFPLPN